MHSYCQAHETRRRLATCVTRRMWLPATETGPILFVWLVAGADLFWEKSTADWLLVVGLFWEKSTTGWCLISQTRRRHEISTVKHKIKARALLLPSQPKSSHNDTSYNHPMATQLGRARRCTSFWCPSSSPSPATSVRTPTSPYT
jgi:hypothetical protein